MISVRTYGTKTTILFFSAMDFFLSILPSIDEIFKTTERKGGKGNLPAFMTSNEEQSVVFHHESYHLYEILEFLLELQDKIEELQIPWEIIIQDSPKKMLTIQTNTYTFFEGKNNGVQPEIEACTNCLRVKLELKHVSDYYHWLSTQIANA